MVLNSRVSPVYRVIGDPVIGFVAATAFITAYARAPEPLPPSNTIVGVALYPDPALVTVMNATRP